MRKSRTQRGLPKVLGYVSQQFNIYRGEATMAFSTWIDKMPGAIGEGLLNPMSEHSDGQGGTLAEPAAAGDAKVGDLKNFHSLGDYSLTLLPDVF